LPTTGYGGYFNSVEAKVDFSVFNYEKRIKLKFKLLAAFYDLFDLAFLLDRKRSPRYALADNIPDEAIRILDVCSGTANSSIAVAQANVRNDIICIDLSPDMIAVAYSKLQKQNIRNISIRQMNATEMSFQDGEFDVAMISFALHEMDYELMLKVLRQMCRVLKDGGKLYIIDYDREKGWCKNLLLSMHLKVFEPKYMAKFLKYDWADTLKDVGFQFISSEKYLFSKLIAATKQSIAS
jgi:ubiquinone/menaquinone biosynthesis C-methylase UbiE